MRTQILKQCQLTKTLTREAQQAIINLTIPPIRLMKSNIGKDGWFIKYVILILKLVIYILFESLLSSSSV